MTASDELSRAEVADPGVYQVLRPDGTLRDPSYVAPTDPDADVLVSGMRWMILSRAFDTRAIALQRQGRVGIVSPVLGQEAAVVASALAFNPQVDWLVPQYRELPAYLIWGFPLEHVLYNMTGRPLLGRIPEHVNMLPTQVAIAAQLPHAAGLAWGLKIQKKDGVVLTYFGDGASSEGDFHEACNLAGVTRAPVVFFLQNNQWAISTPRRLQSAARYLADRATGYGFVGHVVDGNDFLAVHEVTKRAVQRARSGQGPTLIEAITYRLSFHNTTDDPRRYQDPELLHAAEANDPIDRLQRYLCQRGLWDADRHAETVAAAEATIEQAVSKVASAGRSEPHELFDNVFAQLTPELRRQRQELIDRARE
jgi:pyruvate dehydrogenase E1 component alpha subunit